MRTALMAVLLSLIPFGSMAQDNSLKLDGRTWHTWGDSDSQGLIIKAAYVLGALEGLQEGATVGYYAGRMDEKNAALDYLRPCLKGPCAGIPLSHLISDSTKNFAAGADKVASQYISKNISIGDVVQQMDKFYSDYRNTSICMITAAQESVSSLQGTAMSEKDLEMARKTGCKQ